MSLLNVAIESSISTIIVDLGIVILLGFIVGRMFEMIKIPAVTGYLVAGLLLGPITGYMSVEYLNHFSVIGEVALGFIAFQVGNELWFGKLKKSGMKIVIITVIQAVLTTALVAFATSFFVDLPVALMLGAVAAATAPAPIMMIIKKYRTKGALTDTILPVVGLDDAIGVVMFGTLMSISVSMIGSDQTAESGIWHMLAEPLFEIGISIAIGALIGFISGKAIQLVTDNNERKEKNLNVVIITVLLTTGAAILAGASPILTPMVAGAVVTNLINKECFILEEETIRFFIPPLMIAFFTIAGAQLQFDVIIAAGVVGLVYIVGRIIGKFFGAYIGATITKADPKVRKYLGVSLLPQSGVAIGLSVAAYTAFAPLNLEYALVIKNVILASVLFFALTGPVLVKIALFRAKENTIQETERKLSWKNTQVLQK
jgi:Kef-type K+ transport system membrane component KefB